ncbi:MAG TPA: flagellin, partial [bacterium]|nr:flagellin [bacterium]
TVTAKDGSYVELKFATGGPKVGSYTFTVSGTQSETYNSIEINTDNTLKSKLDIGLPLNFTTKSLNIDNVSVGNTLFSKEMLNMVDNAMSKIVQERGKIGATINRLTQALDLAEEQLLAAQRSYSAIADADISYETILNSITKNFLQSNIAMLYGSTINSNAIAGLLNSSNDFKDFDLMGN